MPYPQELLQKYQVLADPNETLQRNVRNIVAVGQALLQEQSKSPHFPSYKWRNPSTGQTHLVTEFKVAAEELLQDIQRRRSEKQIMDINLLLCVSYNETEIRNLQGALVSIQDAGRRFSGVTHQLSYAGHTLEVICLGDVIAGLEKSGHLHRV